MTGNFSEMSVFVRVAQEGSFSAAARRLDLTPSAVSKQIGRLEERLGARLFNRTTRQISLTDVGQAFFARADRILGDLAEAERAVTDMAGNPRGLLRVSVPVAFGRMHLAPRLPRFLAANDEVQIDLTLNDRFADLVEEGFDLALRIGELADSSLIARKLAPNRRLVVAASSYLEAHGRPERPPDLLDHNCLTYTYRAQRHDWEFHGPQGREQIRVSGNLEANDAGALREAVLAGLGVALLPLWLVGEDIRDGRLEVVLPDYPAPDSAIYAVYAPGRFLSPKVRRFVDFLVEEVTALARTWTAE